MAEPVISKIILDHGEYLPRIQEIVDGWKSASAEESKSAQVSKQAIEERVESLDILDKAFIDTMNEQKRLIASEKALGTQIDKTTDSVKDNTAAADDNRKALEKQADKAVETAEQTGLLARMVDGVKNTYNKFTAALKGNRDETGKLTKERRQHLRTYVESKKALKEEIANVTILGTSIGQLNRTVKAAIVVGKAWINVLGKTRIALAATGIGVVVLALTSLVSYLKFSEEGALKFNKAMAGIRQTLRTIVRSVGIFGKGVSDVFSALIKGDFPGVKKAAEAAFAAIGEAAVQAGEDIKQAVSLEAVKNQLRLDSHAMNEEFANTRAEVEKLKKASDDVNLSILERSQAARKANDLETRLLNKQLDLQDRIIAAKQTELALARDSRPIEEQRRLEDELSEAKIRRADLEQSSFTLQTELQNKLNALSTEQTAKIKEQEAALDNLIEGLQEYADTAEFEQASPLEKIAIAEKAAADEVFKLYEGLEKQLEKMVEGGIITQAQADEFIAQGAINLDKAMSQNDAKFQRLRDQEVFKEVEVAPTLKLKTDRIDIDPVDPQKFADKLQLEKAIKTTFKESVGSAMEDAANFIEDNQEIFAAFQGFFNDLTSLFTSGIDARIAKLDEFLEANEEQISELESQRDKEAEKEDLGIANSLQKIDDELAAEKAKREEAIAEREELEKKAAKAQLVNDILQQSSSLITASANIFKAMSSIPFVGVPLAIGFIATMFGAFAKSKIDAAKAAKLHKGTGMLEKTFVGHKSDLYGDGYGIYDPSTGDDMGVRISGKEPLINEAVGQGVNKGLFEEFNKNPQRWKNFDIRAAIRKGQLAVKETKAVVYRGNSGIKADRAEQAKILRAPKPTPKKVRHVSQPTHKEITHPDGLVELVKL